MKEQAIQKINKIGKISNIITLIGKILVGIGLLCAIIGTIICFAIPDSMVKLTTTGNVIMDVDLSSVGVTFSEEELEEARAELEKDMMESEEDYASMDVVLTQNGIHLLGEMDASTFTMRDAAWGALLGAAALLMTFITLCFIGALCKAFRDCQSPFEENVIKKMQNLAYSLIPWTIVSTVANSVSESLTNNHLSIMFSLDLGVVLIVLIVLVLVYIFKYGAVLQQESDETL